MVIIAQAQYDGSLPTILAPASHRALQKWLVVVEASPGLGSCGRNIRGSLPATTQFSGDSSIVHVSRRMSVTDMKQADALSSKA